MSEPRRFSDLRVGDTERFGRCEVVREEVIAFAGRYDPQPFHLDDAAAAANPIFGRLAASGWHTAALTMRMLVDHWRDAYGTTSLGGAGVEELRWLKPVYPGDVLTVGTEILEITASRSRPDRLAIKSRTTTFDQHDEPVMRFVATSFFAKD